MRRPTDTAARHPREDANLRAWAEVVLCLQLPLCMIIQRKTEGGFSMWDVLIVLALLGVGALFLPASRSEASATDRATARDQGFAGQVARELQRARGEAVTSRVPRHAFVYSNRIEIRAAKRGPRPAPGPPPPPPTPSCTPSSPGSESAPSTSPAARACPPSSSRRPRQGIVFNTAGNGALATARAATPAAIHLYITNDTVSDNHPDRAARIDINASGLVSLARTW